jgi:hypothetical protein
MPHLRHGDKKVSTSANLKRSTKTVLLIISIFAVSCGGEDLSPAVDEEGNNFDEFDTPFHTDGDGDGFAPIDGDCDDTNPNRYNGAPEIPDNNVDEDCDGVIDELYNYMMDIQPIWNDNCDSCHIGDMSGDLSLGGYSYNQLVSVSSTGAPPTNLIEPFEPQQSYLYRKITDTHLEIEGGEGDPMPADALLDETTLELIESWILNGCPP